MEQLLDDDASPSEQRGETQGDRWSSSLMMMHHPVNSVVRPRGIDGAVA
jgi:hypothetical protein